ncbi:MAG: DDE-type integrase/transposase/recombinase [Verrucomicrobia bacterium]|nr:DDE-type integrase/transposase/recombinase [Verrucomicrobiota bacterium]
MIELREVLRLWREHLPKKQIAARLGLDPKTVRRYLRAAEAVGLEPPPTAITDEQLRDLLLPLQPTGGRPRGEGWTRCHEQREKIQGWLNSGLRLTKIRKLLARQNVLIAYPSLYRFAIEELHFGQTAATIPILDGEPGKELQVDTGWVGWLTLPLLPKRRPRRFRAWIFTAVRSRYRFVYPTFEETTMRAIEACEAAWQFFHGIFSILIPDNTKAIIAEPDALTPRVTRAFLEYSQARGFQIDPARVRHPRDKARVERAVPTVRDDCFAGEILATLNDARVHACHWCREEYGERLHSRTQRRPREHFEAEEQSMLLPPPTTAYDIPLWSHPKVARDQLAFVAKAFYSLPTSYKGQILSARADQHIVRFYHRNLLIKTHPRKPPGGRSIDSQDYPLERRFTHCEIFSPCSVRPPVMVMPSAVLRQRCSITRCPGRVCGASMHCWAWRVAMETHGSIKSVPSPWRPRCSMSHASNACSSRPRLLRQPHPLQVFPHHASYGPPASMLFRSSSTNVPRKNQQREILHNDNRSD